MAVTEMEKKKPVILFDGVCNLCNSSVNFVIDRDPDGIFQFAALQSESVKDHGSTRHGSRIGHHCAFGK